MNSMIHGRKPVEKRKIASVKVPQDRAVFTNENGHQEVFNLKGRDPNDNAAIVAERRSTDPVSHEFLVQHGRVFGTIMEGRRFIWEHRDTEAEVILAVTAIGVAVNSLWKHYRE